MAVPTTCCGRSGGDCVCASQAKCSCGKQSALHCDCQKASTENTVAGPRCSCSKAPCSTFLLTFPRLRHHQMIVNERESPELTLLVVGARPAGECNCDRAAAENSKVSGQTCSCGQRAAGTCYTCGCAYMLRSPTLTDSGSIGACTCEKAADGGLLPGETDFTTKAK